ncbi:Helix-turn-helix domain-containing protein [Halobacillus dabanensis]|uniref:Helix-turn-helix domain-containing protein n=2 Tax=Halobacillus dabanensis TaxID=240302 RepID=A0A1I3Y9C0_HALDA|nr:Helix-turn-helix domain-containing protein [Halobacillus dabanensis]
MEIGARLKETREAKGLSLESLQETTKIQKRYLQAIEKNEFQVLPGKFYTRAFIREYASAVGLDPEQVMEEHKNELPTFEEESAVQYSRVQRTKKETAQKSGNSSRVLPTILTVGLIVGLIFVVWVVWQNMGDAENENTESNANPNDEINVPEGKEEEDPSNESTENEDAEADESADSTDEKPESSEEKQDGEEESTEGQMDVQLTEEGTGSFPEHTYEITGVSERTVTIELTGRAYMEVQSPKGGEDLVTPKEYTEEESPMTLELGENDSVFIKTGNAPGTVVKVNEQEVPFPDAELSTQKLLLQFK